MHRYLRAIGFSSVITKNQENKLVSIVVKDSNERAYTSLDNDRMLAEYKLYVSDNMGVCVRGEYGEDNVFILDYAVPFFQGSCISSYSDISVERHAEKESYAGVCEDLRLSISLIFYLQNIIPYLKNRNANKLPIVGTSLILSALSIKGMIVLPLEKDKQQISRQEKRSLNRNHMIAKARLGDEEAIESLTMEDMDTYTSIAKRIAKEDVLSLVDTYFMPYGIECDQYSIMGEILDVKYTQNKFSKEKLIIMTINSNDMIFEVCINETDIFGEPKIGRRFKGTIWLLGYIQFPSNV